MYCKDDFSSAYDIPVIVLIVAKCIVNIIQFYFIQGIKYVLIVAKCIVNELENMLYDCDYKVLIVAKCIVN